MDLSSLTPADRAALRAQLNAEAAAADQATADPAPADQVNADQATAAADPAPADQATADQATADDATADDATAAADQAQGSAMHVAMAEALEVFSTIHTDLDELFSKIAWPAGPQFAAVKAWGAKINHVAKVLEALAKAAAAEL